MRTLLIAWIIAIILTALGYPYLIHYIKKRMKEDKTKTCHEAFGESKKGETLYMLAVIIAMTLCPIFNILVMVICYFFPNIVYENAVADGKIVSDDKEDK